jgi:hypothetical protein
MDDGWAPGVGRQHVLFGDAELTRRGSARARQPAKPPPAFIRVTSRTKEQETYGCSIELWLPSPSHGV